MNNEIIRNDETGILDRNIYSGIIEQLKSQRMSVENNLLTQEDLDKVEYLHLENPLDLYGIEKCRNLKTLVVANTAISDIKPVSKLENLKCLSLACNEISDISILGGMTSLERLYLGRNYITDISPIKGLINLERLSLRGNEIQDISPLAGLSKIKDLSLEQNEITDISALGNLGELVSLNISENQIQDMGPIEHLEHIQFLYTEYNDCPEVEESAVLKTFKDMKEKVVESPVIRRHWNEEALQVDGTKKKIILAAVASAVAVVGLAAFTKKKDD